MADLDVHNRHVLRMHRLQEESKDVTLVWNKALAYCQIYDCHELILYPQLCMWLLPRLVLSQALGA